MRLSAIAPARRGAARLLLARALGSLPPPWNAAQPSAEPSASERLPAPPRRLHFRPGAAFSAPIRSFGTQPHSAASKSQCSGLDDHSSSPQPTPKGFEDTHLKKMKVFTRDPSSHFLKHKPVKWITLYADTKETAVVQDSFLTSLSSGLAVLARNRKIKLAFQHPVDLTMWRINSFTEFEIAAGALVKDFSEYDHNLDIYNFALLSEYCLIEFGGVIPSKMIPLFEKMKSHEKNKGYSVLVDPCLIPAQFWSYAFLDAFHIIMHVMTDAERNEFLKKLNHRCQAWDKDMIGNTLLKQFVTYAHPDGTLASRDKNSSKAFLECIRHILSHPLDYLKLMKSLGLGSYTKEDLHLLVQEKVGNKLLKDICDLMSKDRLKELALERYLCREGSSCCPLPSFCIRRKFRDEPCRLKPEEITALKKVLNTRVDNENLFPVNEVLDAWKAVYADKRQRVQAAQGFWEMFASLREFSTWSIWMCVREDDLGDCKSHEALNVICGLLQKMSACRAYSFGKMLVMGTSDKPFKMKGFWVLPGVDVPEFLMDLHGMNCYRWCRVDISVRKERDLINSLLHEYPSDDGPVVAARSL